MSEPEPTTYNDMYQSVKEISSGLRHLGLGKDGWSDEDGKERVGVYADTRYDFRPNHLLQSAHYDLIRDLVSIGSSSATVSHEWATP
jgi:hypothetical protein